MKYSTLIEDMIAEGASPEMILVAVRAVERQEENALERRREADKARQARHRLSRDTTLRHVSHAPSRTHARVEEEPLTQKIEPQESKKVSAPAKPSPRERLESVLDADHAEAVIEHRQRLRKPLTERAAKMLATDLAKFPDPNAAADRMIGKGWLTIEADWPSAQQRAGPMAKPNPGLSTVDALMEKFDAVSPSQAHPNPPYPRLVAPAGGR